MDFITQYGSSFSDDDEEDTTTRNQVKTTADIEQKDVEASVQNVSSMDDSAKVVLLTHPSIDKKMFQRSRSHVQGNWSSHVYINLRHERNEGVYYSLEDHVADLIRDFHQKLLLSTHGRQREKDDLVIVPHIILDRKGTRSNDQNIRSEVDAEHDENSSSEESSDSDSETSTDGECQCEEEYRSLHISISRQFYLQKHSLEAFLAELKERIRIQQRHPINISISAKHCEVLTNDEKTRSFLTIPVTNSSNESVRNLMTIVDYVLSKFGQKRYYSDPKFHISIASWKYEECIERASVEWEKAPCENQASGQLSGTPKDDFIFVVDGIMCDFGTVEKHRILFG
jgi:hypothetical protein